jgi:hypothetical protein
MPRNGSGQYSAPTNSWNLAVNGTLASSGDWQQILDDLASALTQSVSRDGQSPLTGNLDLGNNKINNLSAGTGTGQALAFQQLFDQGVQADIASTATTDIGAQNTNFLRVTGNTTITSFGTNYKGPRFLVFEGAVTLTNSSTLVLPGGANITTAAGDVLILIPGATLGTADKWIVAAYQPAASVLPSVGGFDFRNKIINGNPRINQRGYVSGAATTAGQYTLDRWKVTGTGGITFSTTNNKTTITIPSGQTIQQVIEGLNLDTGTYVLSWEGTAQGRVNSGSYGTSGAVTASVTGGTNTTIEFNAGTVTNIQFEQGTVVTPFERRNYGCELAMCQRYFVALRYSNGAYLGTGQAFNTTSVKGPRIYFPVELRADPTITLPPVSTSNGFSHLTATDGFPTVGSAVLAATGITQLNFLVSGSTYNSSFTAGNASNLYAAGAQVIAVSSEL